MNARLAGSLAFVVAVAQGGVLLAQGESPSVRCGVVDTKRLERSGLPIGTWTQKDGSRYRATLPPEYTLVKGSRESRFQYGVFDSSWLKLKKPEAEKIVPDGSIVAYEFDAAAAKPGSEAGEVYWVNGKIRDQGTLRWVLDRPWFKRGQWTGFLELDPKIVEWARENGGGSICSPDGGQTYGLSMPLDLVLPRRNLEWSRENDGDFRCDPTELVLDADKDFTAVRESWAKWVKQLETELVARMPAEKREEWKDSVKFEHDVGNLVLQVRSKSPLEWTEKKDKFRYSFSWTIGVTVRKGGVRVFRSVFEQKSAQAYWGPNKPKAPDAFRGFVQEFATKLAGDLK